MKQMPPPSERCLHVRPINPGGEIQPWKIANSQRSKRVNSDMSDVTIDDRPDPSARVEKAGDSMRRGEPRTEGGGYNASLDGLLHVSAHTRRIHDSRAWVRSKVAAREKVRHRVGRHLGVLPYNGLVI